MDFFETQCISAVQGETRAGGIHERTRESIEADSHATVSLSSSLLVLLCPSPTSNLWTCYLDNNNNDNNNNNTRWTAVFQFSKVTQVSQCQNATILDFIRTKDEGDGENWSYKTCKAPVRSSPPTNTQLSLGRMPFLSPNQQCQSTEGRSI